MDECPRPATCDVNKNAPRHNQPEKSKLPSVIGVGSCYHLEYSGRDKLTFQSAVKRNPQLWLWLGDTTYIDSFDHKKCGKAERHVSFFLFVFVYLFIFFF